MVTDSQELDHLNTQAVISNKLWQEVGIPRRNSDKRAYRLAIQHAFSQMKKLCILEGSVVKFYVIMQIPPIVSATFCTDTCFQSFSPLINCMLHHALLKFSPCRNKTLLQLIRIADWYLIRVKKRKTRKICAFYKVVQ